MMELIPDIPQPPVDVNPTTDPFENPELIKPLTDEEKGVVQELNNLAQEGERLLEKLQSAIEGAKGRRLEV